MHIRANITSVAKYAHSWSSVGKLLLKKKIAPLSKPAFVSGVRSFSSTNGLNQSSSSPTPEPSPTKKGLFDRIFSKEASVAPETFTNRWAMAIPAFFTHLSLGAPYAWSLMADLVTREQGFVASAASDWTLMQAALPLSLVFVFQGLAAATLGSWQAKVGPKKCLLYASVAFG
jgi:hypothetical protein